MSANVRHAPRDDEFSEEAPTRPLPPSGKWICAVDRGARRLEAAIELLESGSTEPQDLIDALKEVHNLVTRGEP